MRRDAIVYTVLAIILIFLGPALFMAVDAFLSFGGGRILQIDPDLSKFEVSEKILSVAVALSGSLVAIAIAYRAMRVSQQQADLVAQEQNVAIEQRQMEFRERVRDIFEAAEDLTIELLNSENRSAASVREAFETAKTQRKSLFDSIRRLEELSGKSRLTEQWRSFFEEKKNISYFSQIASKVKRDQESKKTEFSRQGEGQSASEIFARVRAARPDDHALDRIATRIDLLYKIEKVRALGVELKTRFDQFEDEYEKVDLAKREEDAGKREREASERQEQEASERKQKLANIDLEELTSRLARHYKNYKSPVESAYASNEKLRESYLRAFQADFQSDLGMSGSQFPPFDALEMLEKENLELFAEAVKETVTSFKRTVDLNTDGGGTSKSEDGGRAGRKDGKTPLGTDKEFAKRAQKLVDQLENFIVTFTDHPERLIQDSFGHFRPSEVSVSGSNEPQINFFDRCLLLVLGGIIFSQSASPKFQLKSEPAVCLVFNVGVAFLLDLMRCYRCNEAHLVSKSPFGYRAELLIRKISEYPMLICSIGGQKITISDLYDEGAFNFRSIEELLENVALIDEPSDSGVCHWKSDIEDGGDCVIIRISRPSMAINSTEATRETDDKAAGDMKDNPFQ